MTMKLFPRSFSIVSAVLCLIATPVKAEPSKQIDARILLLDADIKSQVSHYETINTSLLNAISDAKSPAAKDKDVLAAVSEKISYLIEEKKASEASLKQTVAKYNALAGSN
jgi:hypothetical protein